MNSARSYGILCTATTDRAVPRNQSKVGLPSHDRADFARYLSPFHTILWNISSIALVILSRGDQATTAATVLSNTLMQPAPRASLRLAFQEFASPLRLSGDVFVRIIHQG
jgi:hypothetical protein